MPRRIFAGYLRLCGSSKFLCALRIEVLTLTVDSCFWVFSVSPRLRGRCFFFGCGSAALWLTVLFFRSRAMTAIPAMTAIFASLCLHPSASDPPPIAPLLKTKIKPQFDRAVDRTVEAFFSVFQGFNRGQFRRCFLVSTVRSAEGRKRKGLVFLANYQLPIASCLFVKDPLPHSGSSLGGNTRIYHLFALSVKRKRSVDGRKTASPAAHCRGRRLSPPRRIASSSGGNFYHSSPAEPFPRLRVSI
jgi:hypothetical protein